MKLGYNKITIYKDRITLDGVDLVGTCIASPVTINHGGPNTVGPSITLTIYGDEITMTDEAKAFAKEHGSHVVEIWGDKQ